MKECSKCFNILVLNKNNFHQDKYQKDGFTNECKACRLKNKKRYDETHREENRNKALNNYYNNLNRRRKISLDYYHNNKEKCLLNNKIWCNENLEIRREHKLRSNSKRRAIIKGANADHISKQQLIWLIGEYPNCPYCNVVLCQKNTEIDHVYPLSKGGMHIIDNLMPVCKVCNNKKLNKLPIDWVLSIKGIIQ